MTPIAEMSIERVTQAEADAYRQWRDRYQQNWQWAFDPIALRLTVRRNLAGPVDHATDLGHRVSGLISVSQGAAIPPGRRSTRRFGACHLGDQHEVGDVAAAKQFCPGHDRRHAIRSSELAGELGSLYLDDGPFWDELAKVETDQREKFLEEQGWRMPLAVRADVSSG